MSNVSAELRNFFNIMLLTLLSLQREEEGSVKSSLNSHEAQNPNLHTAAVQLSYITSI